MKAKEYLKQLQRLDTVIDQKIKEVDALRLTARSTGSIDYSKNRVQTSPSGDASFVNTVHKMIDLEQEINREIDFFIDEKHKIINQIQSLRNEKHIDILYKHYVEFKRLEVIAVEMNYTYQYTRELHGHALREFENKFLH